MTVYYLDSSAWVKRYVFEVGSDFVGNLFSRKESLACSALGLVEITATLARKRKAGDLGEAELGLLIARSRKGLGGLLPDSIVLGGSRFRFEFGQDRSIAWRGCSSLGFCPATGNVSR